MYYLFFSDVTYSNPCKLKAAVCKNNLPGLAVAYKGMCAEKEPIIEAQGYIYIRSALILQVNTQKVYAVLPFYDVKCLCSGERE